MPQISQLAATYASQIFWLLLTFGITFFVVGLYMYPRIQGTARARDDKIKGDLEEARKADLAAEEAEEAYRVKINKDRADAQQLVAEAKAQAAGDMERKMAAADADLDRKLDAAMSDIATQKQAAMADVESAAIDAAQQMIRQLAGIEVTSEVASRQVKAELQNG